MARRRPRPGQKASAGYRRAKAHAAENYHHVAELVHMAAKHARDLRLVNPAYTTMGCGDCGARAKHRLCLSERTYTCCSCGVSKPRDRNSAAVMVVRAGFNPAGVDRIRLERPLGAQAA